MARVSFSQYSMWSGCAHQYKLSYIDDLSIDSTNINLIFGQSMHETLQHFLSVMYGTTKSAAMNINLNELLQLHLTENFKKEKEKLPEGTLPCTKEELQEFFQDGKMILLYFRNKLTNFFSKSGYELVAIELPLNIKIKEHVNFVGFLDVVIRDTATNEIFIVDFKTSTKGWGKYQKKDKVKNSQLLLYKKFYAEKYNISQDMISVEFHILKRKLMESEYTIPRISKHIPANGKQSVNKAWDDFMNFVNTVFDEEGNYRKEIEYPKKPSKLCEWCEFFHRGICDGKL